MFCLVVLLGRRHSTYRRTDQSSDGEADAVAQRGKGMFGWASLTRQLVENRGASAALEYSIIFAIVAADLALLLT